MFPKSEQLKFGKIWTLFSFSLKKGVLSDVTLVSSNFEAPLGINKATGVISNQLRLIFQPFEFYIETSLNYYELRLQG